MNRDKKMILERVFQPDEKTTAYLKSVKRFRIEENAMDSILIDFQDGDTDELVIGEHIYGCTFGPEPGIESKVEFCDSYLYEEYPFAEGKRPEAGIYYEIDFSKIDNLYDAMNAVLKKQGFDMDFSQNELDVKLTREMGRPYYAFKQYATIEQTLIEKLSLYGDKVSLRKNLACQYT